MICAKLCLSTCGYLNVSNAFMQVFRETVFYEWHLQMFTCRLSLTDDGDEQVQNSVTLSVTGELFAVHVAQYMQLFSWVTEEVQLRWTSNKTDIIYINI